MGADAHAKTCDHARDDPDMIQRFPDTGMVACLGCGEVLEEAQPGTAVARPAAMSDGVQPVDPIVTTMDVPIAGEILTPDECVAHIADCVARLERGAAFHRKCIQDLYEARRAYERAFDNAMADASGAADQRKSYCNRQAEAELDQMEAMAMREKAVRTAMHDVRAMLSGYQSMANSVRATYQAAGQAYGRGAPY